MQVFRVAVAIAAVGCCFPSFAADARFRVSGVDLGASAAEMETVLGPGRRCAYVMRESIAVYKPRICSRAGALDNFEGVTAKVSYYVMDGRVASARVASGDAKAFEALVDVMTQRYGKPTMEHRESLKVNGAETLSVRIQWSVGGDIAEYVSAPGDASITFNSRWLLQRMESGKAPAPGADV